MPQRFAEVDADGVVQGFYVDDVNPEIPQGAVELTEEQYAAWIADTSGQRWNGTGLEAYSPPAPVAAPVRRIRSLAFRERLSPDKRKALSVAAMQAAGAGDGSLLTFLLDQASSVETDLDDPRVVEGVAALRAGDLVTEAEATAMLADGTPAEAI